MSVDTPLIERILLAAGLPDAEISARVTGMGPDAVAGALLAEVCDRAALLNGPAERFVIQCDLGFEGARLGYLLTLGDGVPRVEKGWDGEAAATIRQDLVDLLRELFGPAGPYGVTREVSVKEYFNSEYSPAIAAGMWPVLGAMRFRTLTREPPSSSAGSARRLAS